MFFTAFFVVAPIFWGKDLLCSHDNLFIATAEPTAFCQIQGMYVCTLLPMYLVNKNSFYSLPGFGLDAALLIYSQFWLLFVFHLFMKIVDPLKTWIINKQEYARRTHIIEVVAVFFFGLITPITTIAATDGYYIATFPPRGCFSEAKVFFHGILLPNLMMCMVGICLILVTLFHIHRVSMYIA